MAGLITAAAAEHPGKNVVDLWSCVVTRARPEPIVKGTFWY
jgi:hypothetical protein